MPARAAGLLCVQIIAPHQPFSAPANFRAADIAAVRDPATTKITTGEAKPDQGHLRELNAQLQQIMDLPRP